MTFWDGRKVFVTGANGFAGSNLCRSLADVGASVSALVRSRNSILNLEDLGEVEIVTGDITDPSSIGPLVKGIDTIFNSAAIVQIEKTRESPQDTLSTNIIGAYNVAESALKNRIRRLIHVSTCHVYGNQPQDTLPIRETNLPKPHDLYAVSKLASEMVLKPLIDKGLDVVITRAFNHYGPGQTGNFFVPNTIKQLLIGNVPHLGNPTPTRDYTYVRDVTDGYVLAGEKGRSGEVYHFSSGNEISISNMYKKIAEACGADGVEAVWEAARKQDMSRSFGDSEKAKKELGWQARTSLEDGLSMTVKWWKDHPDIWKVAQ